MQVVEKDRSPGRRRQLGAQLLCEREVHRHDLSHPGYRTATVDQPVEQRKREIVAEPDEPAGGEQLGGGLRDADALDQVVDEQGGRPQSGDDQQDDELQRPAMQQTHTPRDTLWVGCEQHDEQHDFDRGQQPRYADCRFVRQPPPNGDVQREEEDERRGGPEPRLT